MLKKRAVAGLLLAVCLTTPGSSALAGPAVDTARAAHPDLGASAPGFAPPEQTQFAPMLELVPPGPHRAERALVALDRQLDFQRRISFHPELGASLQKVVDVMPPRQSTLIRAAALYPRSDIPWTGLPDGSHQISVTGRPFGENYFYALSGKYIEPEEPNRMGGRFALRPASGEPDNDIDCVTGSLGGELLLDSYGGGAIVDSLAAILRQTRGDLRPPWDKAPGQFNRHDEVALARFRNDFPALSAKLDHYLKYRNVLDEFDSSKGPIVLFNLDAEIREDALKVYPHLHGFYRANAYVVDAQSALIDPHGNYWLRTRFEHGHIHLVFMVRGGMLTPFDAQYHPAGDSLELAQLGHGSYRTEASATISKMGMLFGLDHLGFTTDFRRDSDSVIVETHMNEVPQLVAPPGVHQVADMIAGKFLTEIAQRDGGFRSIVSSRNQHDGLFLLAAGMQADFDYSPTLEFLARMGDSIAEAHNEKVREEERKLGEELFDAFVSDYNAARPKILSLDAEGTSHQ